MADIIRITVRASDLEDAIRAVKYRHDNNHYPDVSCHCAELIARLTRGFTVSTGRTIEIEGI